MRAEPNGAAVTALNLTKLYRNVLAVDGIDFTVPRGSVVGLLGGNGAGKTTTIAMILGLIEPTRGSITVLGHDMVRHRHRVLGRMNFESPYVSMPMRLTVRQNLTVYGRLYGLDRLKERIAALADALDLKDLLERQCGKLSAGQRTRVGLAKSLINEPQLLLLDEPTASLDPDTADWVRGHLERFRERRGATILLASHNMPEVERLCDHVIIMKQGRIVDEGTPLDLIKRFGRANLEDVFLAVARSDEFTPRAAESA